MRFPGFEGEWEEKKLQDVVTMTSGGTPSMQRSEYWVGDIPFITAASMRNTVISTSHQHITKDGLRNGSRLLQKGNLLLLVRGSMLWKQIPICYNTVDVAFNQDVKAIIPNNKITSNFLLYWFQSKEGILKNSVTATGIGAGKLASDELLAMQMLIPASIEQSKIAALLDLIDQRIQTQNKIIEKLESLMEVLKESLFSQKLRFQEFLEKWTTYRVSDFLEFFSTNSLSWDNLKYNSGGIFNLHYGLIHQGLPTQVDMSEQILPSIRSEKILQRYEPCQDGDLAFADASEDTKDVAKVIEFINCDGKVITCGLHTIHARDKLNLTVKGFKGYLFSSKYFRNQIRQLAQGTKVFAISPKSFKECYVDIPVKGEQLKIAETLILIDKKLRVEKRLLLKFQEQKSFLLQNLFI